MRIGLHDIAQSAATDGQVPGWDDLNGLWVPSTVVRGLTSGDASVTITDNGDGTLDLAAAGGGGGGGGAGIRYSDTLGATDFTSTTNNAYTTISGLTFSFTPAVNGLLMLNARVRAKISLAGNCYLQAVISPSPVLAPADIGSSNESMTAGKLRTFPLNGIWDVAASTAYAVTVQFFQTGGGTFTADHTASETELVGLFIPS